MIRLISFLSILIPTAALAQAAEAPTGEMFGANSQYASFLPLILIFGVFYFVLIRPQQKRMKEHQLMLGALKKGDEVVTAGGIVGKITKADAGLSYTIEIAKGVEVNVLKSTISSMIDPDAKLAGATVKTAVSKKGNKNDNSAPSRKNIANDN